MIFLTAFCIRFCKTDPVPNMSEYHEGDKLGNGCQKTVFIGKVKTWKCSSLSLCLNNTILEIFMKMYRVVSLMRFLFFEKIEFSWKI